MGLTKRQKQSRAAAASRWEPSQAESDDDTISESSLMSDEFEMLDEDSDEDAESMKSSWARFMKAFVSTFPLKDCKRPLGRAGDGDAPPARIPDKDFKLVLDARKAPKVSQED